MKSLEIVNELIYKCNDFLGDCITCASKENLEQIKADLEVLEIIKNKSVDIPMLKRVLARHKWKKNILEIYNSLVKVKITMEELLKLKQWLEENEG